MVTLLRRRTTPACRLALLACLAPALSALVLGALVLAGCNVSTAKVMQYHPDPAVVQQTVDCPASISGFPGYVPTASPSSLAGSVPEGFVPEQVFICRTGDSEVAGEHKVLFQQEQLAGDFAPLLAALAEPSDRQSGADLCTADLELIPGLWLVNAADETVQVTWPLDSCRKTRGKPDTQKAINALNVVDILVLPVPEQGK